MGSVKRKPMEYPTAAPPLKQLKEDDNGRGSEADGTLDEPVACLHDVSYPDNYVDNRTSDSSIKSSPPAKEFPFSLDPFQTEAIKCLDSGESVLVCYQDLIIILLLNCIVNLV